MVEEAMRLPQPDQIFHKAVGILTNSWKGNWDDRSKTGERKIYPLGSRKI